MKKAGFLLLVLCGAQFVCGNPLTKREIFGEGYGVGVHPVTDFGNLGFGQDFQGFSPQPSHLFNQPQIWIQKLYSAPSPAEIATAVTAAKEASVNVMAAQERVQAAKHDVLTQQKIAIHKEAQAALALQQTEAAAAVQRQQASSAANAVVFAQQRLAQAKADVAEHQRVAAAKETTAAAAIQRSAAAAAAEIRKSENSAAKVAALRSSEAAAALKHVTAAKDATLGATSAAVAAIGQFESAGSSGAGPWLIPEKIAHFSPWG